MRDAEPGVAVNRTECVLSRLGTVRAGKGPFLEPHQLEAGLRLQQLVDRAHLRTKTTMSYSAAQTIGHGRGGYRPADIPAMAADARRELRRLYKALSFECMDLLVDICGFEKGLQVVERERGWPRRSAKLVLKIGLEQLAGQFGLASVAKGMRRVKSAFWLEEGARPDIFG